MVPGSNGFVLLTGYTGCWALRPHTGRGKNSRSPVERAPPVRIPSVLYSRQACPTRTRPWSGTSSFVCGCSRFPMSVPAARATLTPRAQRAEAPPETPKMGTRGRMPVRAESSTHMPDRRRNPTTSAALARPAVTPPDRTGHHRAQDPDCRRRSGVLFEAMQSIGSFHDFANDGVPSRCSSESSRCRACRTVPGKPWSLRISALFFLFIMPAKLLSHCGQNPVGIIAVAARCKARK